MQVRDDVSVLMSSIPSTLVKAVRTELAQPPQVMPGSFKDTVVMPSASTVGVVAEDSVVAGLSASFLAGASAPESQPIETTNMAIANKVKIDLILNSPKS